MSLGAINNDGFLYVVFFLNVLVNAAAAAKKCRPFYGSILEYDSQPRFLKGSLNMWRIHLIATSQKKNPPNSAAER